MNIERDILILMKCQPEVLDDAVTYMRIYFLGMPVIDNSIVKNINLDVNYVFNLTNYTHRHDKQNTFEFLYTVGAGVGLGAESNTGNNFRYGINTSFRAVYNISSLAGLYIEPKVSYLNFDYVRPSISAGFTFRIKSTDPGFEKPVDTDRKKILFALKSNALFWIAGAPNFGIEYPINDRWSICGDYVAPWASSSSLDICSPPLIFSGYGLPKAKWQAAFSS